MTQTELPSAGGVARRATADHLTRRVGRWELIELAAEGSRTQIYRARSAGAPSDQPAAYAVKALRDEWQDDILAVELLAREALVGRRVSHAHLVPVLETHVARPPRYLVMPWLRGTTLHARLTVGPPIELPVAIWIARQVAEALHALDSAGWVHGDVKPSNIFLSPEGHVTLLDLGFARQRAESGPPAQRGIAGTCNYLAPECLIAGCAGDMRSDIYSLGAVLFETLSGRLPVEGANVAELIARHKQAAPPNLRQLVPQLPGVIARLVQRMLAKDPLRRPQTPGELIEHLIDLEIATFSERAA